MATSIRLSDYTTTPLYNIKAVVQATHISPSTLRAWERRYHMCDPQRSESGYRLYSDRDIAVIRWLKAQVDAGMAISQAVSWLQSIVADSQQREVVSLPDPTGRVQETPLPAFQSRVEIHSLHTLRDRLVCALLAYDEGQAEQILAEAFALYPLEMVGELLIMPTLVELGERWHRGELNITREHYATSYLLQRVSAILRALPGAATAPVVWAACAPGEFHEIGLLLLGVYLRRIGYQVHYLGQDLPEADLLAELRQYQPDMILFSASGTESALRLRRLCAQIAEQEPPRPIIGYGGRIFNLQTELRDQMAGVFLGTTAAEAVEMVGELLAQRPSANRVERSAI